jgi:phospholipid/cholesterol/gamma-HCH transport system substrate-binding protein
MNSKNFAVGLFVSTAIVAFSVATIWLTGKQGSEPTVSYSMFFERDVGGLMLGGPVFYMGVNVGSVTAMEIIPANPEIKDNPTRVRVDARVLKSAPVNAGTYASLALQGITGVAVIKLNADPGKRGSLETDKGSGFQVIAVRDTGFSALLAKAPHIVDKMDHILVQINEILGEKNREFVSDILGDISTVSGALASREETISDLPLQLEKALEELNSSLVTINTMAGELRPGLSSTVANLDQATLNLAEMTKRLETWMATNDSDMNAFMEGGLGQVPAMVSDARSALREIEKLVRDLRENPSALIYKPNEDAIDVEQ